MKKYLKVANYFGGDVTVNGFFIYCHVDGESSEIAECGSGKDAEYAAHAINSHDELVQMNQELLAALEGAIDFLTFEGFGGVYVGIREDYDITEEMKPFLAAISKAKGGAE